jgi:uncharacterized protein YozE (UPF0346 family)
VTFYDWLQAKYSGKDSPRGDLAVDAKRDSGFPRTATDREVIRTHLRLRGACRECMAIFGNAFRAYSKEKSV